MIEVLKKLIHDEKGQGMVEFSFVLITLVTGAMLLVSAVKVNNR
jgi:hypothetical protein